MVTGSCGYVLPRIQNRLYLELKQGAYFGHSELASNKKFMDLTNFKSLSGIIMRNFTVQSFENSELLSLNMGDLFKMKLEFQGYFKEIIDDAVSRLNNELMLKLEVLRIAELEVEKQDSKANHMR